MCHRKMIVTTVADVSLFIYKHCTILLFQTDKPRRGDSGPDVSLSDKSSTCHIRHRWATRQKAEEEFWIGKGAGKRERVQRKPYFSLRGFHKGKLYDCQCQSDRVFYEHLAGPRPGLCSQAVIAVPIVGLRGEERPCAIERGGARPCLPALCSVLAE